MLQPGPRVAPVDEHSQSIIEALGERGGRGELGDFMAQGEACRWCARPVRLEGGMWARDPASGSREPVSSSVGRSHGVVLKACGNRRASVCPSCASLYRSDARHIVRAGLSGEKGVGERVVGRPAVFLTLTAPSFGAVHLPRGAGVCRPGDPRARCPHGRRRACFEVHRPDDPAVGSALCPRCYDYEGAVLHNASTPELWRRFTVYLPRALAGVLELTQAETAARIRLATCRVAEFQRRGLVHLHAVIRADGVDGGDPPAVLGPEQLVVACRMAAALVQVTHDRGRARFGAQMDVQVLGEEPARVRKAAAYVAKYASKSASSSGALDRRIHHEAEIARRRLSAHEAAMVRAAWALGAGPGRLGLRRHAHSLGYGGLFLSKSRSYSVTFASLRGARSAWRRARLEERLGITGATYESSWRAVGVGWCSPGEAAFAAQMAEAQEEARRIAWEESQAATAAR